MNMDETLQDIKDMTSILRNLGRVESELEFTMEIVSIQVRPDFARETGVLTMALGEQFVQPGRSLKGDDVQFLVKQKKTE